MGMRGREWRTGLSAAVASAAIVAAAISALQIVVGDSPSGPPPPPSPSTTRLGEPGRTEIQARLNALDEELAALQRQVEQLSTPQQQGAIAAQVTRTEQSLVEIRGRLGALESAILTDPAKALQLPLLGREVADLRTRLDTGTESLRGDIDRVYDLTKTSVIALAVSVLGAVVGSIFLKRE